MSENITRNNSYRLSASVIIAAKTEYPEDGYDYNVTKNLLLLKRTPQTAFAPEHCVFPGGVLDNSDESIEWLKYFKEFGIKEHELQQLVAVSDNRPQFLTPQGTGCYDRFFKKTRIWARDISLRITALRETFEEVGILLSRHYSNSNNIKNSFEYEHKNFDREHWQQLVHNDASQFLQLCKTLNIVPDLWCLQEWSAWRSPETASRKFDTVFYFVALERIPSLLPEISEVASTMWKSPHTLLCKFDERVIWLPLMIFYELSRLTNISDLQDLFNFAYQRSRKHSTTLLMPVYYRCTDAIMGILPGDEAYPLSPTSIKETIPVNVSAMEFRKGIKSEHRFVLHHMHDLSVYINIPIDGHLPPIRSSPKRSKL